jgi:iron complex transport system substrate-binding protein
MLRTVSTLFLWAWIEIFSSGKAYSAQRVISLDLCTDWMLARYADRGQVAALSPMHRQFPVAWLDNSWPTHDGTLERIVELKPDLVITGQYNAPQLRSRLKTLGFRVEILPLPSNLEAVSEYEKQLLSLLGQPLSLASFPPPPVKSHVQPKRLLLLGANGIGTGRGTFEDGIWSGLGGSNYLRGRRLSTPRSGKHRDRSARCHPMGGPRQQWPWRTVLRNIRCCSKPCHQNAG